jgi:hypothetical protein
MKLIGTAILILLVVLLALAIGGAVFALLAYGVGMLVTRFTGLDVLPATVISMAGMVLFGILVERVFNSVLSMPRDLAGSGEFEDDEEDEFDFDEEPELSEKEMEDLFPGIPRWRRPSKPLDFSNVQPDDRCPCGSGRKYKNCHGRKPRQTAA